MDYFPPEILIVLQVIFINVVLSGDNAIVVGMAAAGTPPAIRSKVIFYGITGAVILRVLLALLAVQFLQVVGLLFAGGVLLLWVCWKLYSEIRESAAQHFGTDALSEMGGSEVAAESTKTLGEAMWQILVADVSMSLDNVLAVAGAARDHPYIMAAGLVLSVAIMGAAATIVARLLDRYKSLAWLGLIVIVYVAVRMIWEGGWEIGEALEIAAALFTPPTAG
jgi:YjbE family integral membrane protein